MRDLLDVSGSVALVTGAASGMGEACARLLACGGADVMLVDRDNRLVDTARLLESKATGRVAYLVGDLVDPDHCERMVRSVCEDLGPLTIAINAAGVAHVPYRRLGEVDLAQWSSVVDGNLTTTFLAMRAEIRAMVAGGTGGSIVNFASTLGVSGSASGLAAYVAAKHAVVGLTKAAALEYAADAIRVNVVGPGIVETPMTASWKEDKRDSQVALHPRGRFGAPEEVASMAYFLSTAAAANCTGGYFPVDGGFGAH